MRVQNQQLGKLLVYHKQTQINKYKAKEKKNF
jgi:hypothetical protein